MKVSQFDKVLHYFGNCGYPYIQAQIKALLSLHSRSKTHSPHISYLMTVRPADTALPMLILLGFHLSPE